jgi:hypothetical protein
MPLDTVTLALSGEVPFARYAEAVRRFYALVQGLTAEARADHVEWIMAELNVGSALATIRGIGPAEEVEPIVRRYGEIGVELSERPRLSPGYSPQVRAAAYGLRRIPGGRVESVVLETAEREAILRPTEPRAPGQPRLIRVAPAPLEGVTIRQATAAFGAIEGRVQTLSSRGGLRFTLYDTLNDKAVSCYLAEGYENIMRDAWGRLAVVEGWVSRDPLSGRPLAVRRVRDVKVLPERSPGSYRDARGAAPSLSGMLAEQAIRRLRDA